MQRFNNSSEMIKFWNTVSEDTAADVRDTVSGIISVVRKSGDTALTEFTSKFDGVTPENIKVSAEMLKQAKVDLPDELSEVIREAAGNIRRFHERQKPESWTLNPEVGILLRQQYSPLDSVGIYVPGGNAVYPSTVLMNVIPAQVAGVKRIAIVSPPDSSGNAARPVLACASLLGIDEVYSVGGAQAVAALAYGTETIPPVAKITGPGNKYVNEAKLQVFGKVGIDIPAGPTELVIVADESAPLEFILWDICAQAEHDADARVAVITTNKELAGKVQSEIIPFAAKTENSEIALKAIQNGSSVICLESLDSTINLVNELAPEHLELMIENSISVSERIVNTGAVFCGNYTPNALGDYWAGPNHTLPTSGAARFASPLGVADFMKFTSVTSYSRDQMKSAAGKAALFARTEKLFSHAQSLEVRNDKS